MGELWLAPLRGVTIRAFREAFAAPIREAGLFLPIRASASTTGCLPTSETGLTAVSYRR